MNYKIYSIIVTIYCCQFIAKASYTIALKSIRNTPFEYFAGNKRFSLVEGVLENFQVSRASTCAKPCMWRPKYKLFNFCHRTSCELLSEDVFSTERGPDDLLMDSPNCKYMGMKKIDQPFCKVKGKLKSVTDDSGHEKCEINGKRVDKSWGPWELETVIDTSTEMKQVEKRRVSIDSAHGGKNSGESIRTVFWIQRIYEKNNWEEARQNCEKIGGQLFDNLNGTTAQLDLMIRNMEITDDFYFLGAQKDTAASTVYKNMHGQVIDPSLFVWAYSGEPSQWVNETKIGLYPRTDNRYSAYIYDLKFGWSKRSICDMMKR